MVKGLGAKYGRTLRMRLSKTYLALKAKRACPQCGAPRLRRDAAGIWRCRKCSLTIVGGAYDIGGRTRS